MLPSGSLEPLPSSKTLSAGKVITWSCPATAIGVLFFSESQFSHEVSFLQEEKLTITTVINRTEYCVIFFMIKTKLLSPKKTTVAVIDPALKHLFNLSKT